MKKVIRSDVGIRVEMARQKMNIKKLHEQTGLSRTTISNLVNGYARGMKFDSLAKLCDALNCTPEKILIYEEEK